MSTWTAEELLLDNESLRLDIQSGIEYQCAICGCDINWDDDDIELVHAEHEYIHADCLHGILTEDLFWQYIVQKELKRDVCEWFYANDFTNFNHVLENALIAGMRGISKDDMWTFIQDDVEHFAEWLINNEKKETTI